jgi:hypothetical protein
MLKLRLDIPIRAYLICMTRLGVNSPEYIKLKNGVVLRDAGGNEVVEILCDDDRAKRILEATAKSCPDAFPQIQHHIAPPSDSWPITLPEIATLRDTYKK